MGHSAPFAVPNLYSLLRHHRTDSDNGVILAERFRNTTSESRLNGEKTCQGSGLRHPTSRDLARDGQYLRATCSSDFRTNNLLTFAENRDAA